MASMRVHELAKEFDMTSKELLDKLNEMKIPAKSHASMLADAYVAKIRKNLEPEIKQRAGQLEAEEAAELARERAEAEARKAEEERARREAVEQERAAREAERARREAAEAEGSASMSSSSRKMCIRDSGSRRCPTSSSPCSTSSPYAGRRRKRGLCCSCPMRIPASSPPTRRCPSAPMSPARPRTRGRRRAPAGRGARFPRRRGWDRPVGLEGTAARSCRQRG